MLPGHGSGPVAARERETESREDSASKTEGGILVTDGLARHPVSVGSNANNGSQIHFGNPRSMEVASRVRRSE